VLLRSCIPLLRVGGATSEGQFIFSLIPLSLLTEKLELYKQIWRNEMKEVLTIVGWLLSFDLVINPGYQVGY
jgi:hypothetical protein